MKQSINVETNAIGVWVCVCEWLSLLCANVLFRIKFIVYFYSNRRRGVTHRCTFCLLFTFWRLNFATCPIHIRILYNPLLCRRFEHYYYLLIVNDTISLRKYTNFFGLLTFIWSAIFAIRYRHILSLFHNLKKKKTWLFQSSSKWIVRAEIIQIFRGHQY